MSVVFSHYVSTAALWQLQVYKGKKAMFTTFVYHFQLPSDMNGGMLMTLFWIPSYNVNDISVDK